MKTKKLLLVLFTIFVAVACKKAELKTLIFSKPNLVFANTGGEETVEIITAGDWSISLEEGSWIKSVKPSAGSGQTVVTVTVEEYDGEERRETKLIANDVTLSVVQEATTIIESKLYGEWRSPGDAFIFNFNEDTTCSAYMTMGGGVEYDGVFTVVGNIIQIDIDDSEMVIRVVVSSLDDETMEASVNGQALTLTKS